METFLISGIVIGIICIVASFLIKDKSHLSEEEMGKIENEIRSMILTEKSIDSIISGVKAQFNLRLEDLVSEKVVQTEDYLNEKSNEKMIAFNEMYEGMIEKIEHNHKEVLFLYDMLNQKGEELKAFTSQIEGMRKGLQEEEKKLIMTYQLINKKMKVINGGEVNKKTKERLENNGEKSINQLGKKVERKKSDDGSEHVNIESSDKINERIFALNDEGKSITEISKELGIGKGEVSLILGLFAKKK